jgi:hypothetical protein
MLILILDDLFLRRERIDGTMVLKCIFVGQTGLRMTNMKRHVVGAFWRTRTNM